MARCEAQDAEALTAQLEHWYAKDRRHADIEYYLFSEEWELEEKERWDEYSELCAQRQSLCLPVLDWQAQVEDKRQTLATFKQRLYRPVDGKLVAVYPLYIRLSFYTGRAISDRKYPWKQMHSSWEEFRRLYASDEAFRSLLSETQHSSYLVLRDWWDALYCEPHLLRATKEELGSYINFASCGNPLHSKAIETARTAMKNASLYHAACYTLFLREFHPSTFEPYKSLVQLYFIQGLRHQVGNIALAQRLSFATLYPGHPTSTSPLVQSYPKGVLHNAQPLPRTNVGESPTYLWDTEQMRTVTVRDLRHLPDYICVSHTWGRWRRKYLRAAKVPGVPWRVPRNSRFRVQDLPASLKLLKTTYVWIDLFCIPQDGSKEADEEIARQADIFRRSRKCIAWMNDVESWTGVQNSLKWLNLKLQRNTRRPSISWMDSPVRWVTDEALASAAQAAQMPAELCENGLRKRVWPIAWFSSLWTLQEAVLCPDLVLCTRDWTALKDDWGVPITLRVLMAFLKEASDYCLSNGPLDEPFGDISQYAHSLSIHQNTPTRLTDFNAWPLGPQILIFFLRATRLDSVFDRSATEVCIHAHSRYCQTNNRAPAIMSALGVTDWYRRRLLLPDPQKPLELVYNMYPLEFLEEMLARFGASFFDTGSFQIRIDTESRESLCNGQSMGTMLPFTAKQGLGSGIAGELPHPKVEVLDHPSVSTWRIRSDGSVSMASAEILLSSTSPELRHAAGDPGAHATTVLWVDGLYSADAKNKFQRAQTDDPGGLLRSIAGKDGVVHAVSLYTDCYRKHGILLYGIVSSQRVNTSSPLHFMKIGNFVAHHWWDATETIQVNWVVL